MAIRIAMTTKVYGRPRASRTIHIRRDFAARAAGQTTCLVLHEKYIVPANRTVPETFHAQPRRRDRSPRRAIHAPWKMNSRAGGQSAQTQGGGGRIQVQ